MNLYKQNNQYDIPALGLGTYRVKPEDCEIAVAHGLNKGYRLIDTANIYMNEKAVARGMKTSGVAREDIYLTSKIWPSEFAYEKAKKAIDATLERLDTPYLDLLLLHQSVGKYVEAYKAMEEAVAQGKLRSIGLSNFTGKELDEILRIANIKPVLVQVECHPYHQQKELKKILDENQILLEAWYPLGSGDKKLQEEPILLEMAAKYGKSVIQILLRWHIQYGNVVIPGSKNPNHITSNMDIFDFELTEEEMNAISRLDKKTPYFKVPRWVQRILFTNMRMNYNNQI